MCWTCPILYCRIFGVKYLRRPLLGVMSDCVLEGVRGVEATWDREGGGVLARLGAEGEWEPGVGGGWRHVSTRAWVQ